MNYTTPASTVSNGSISSSLSGLTAGKRYTVIAVTTSATGGGSRTLSCSGTIHSSYLVPNNYSGTSNFHTYFFADVTATNTSITFSGSSGTLNAWAFSA